VVHAERARLAEHRVVGEQRGAERAAGVARGGLHPQVLERPSRTIRPFATQLSATPPAMHRFFMPVRRCRSRTIASTISSVTFWMLAAMSQWNCSIGPSMVATG
jgi:hypothetical protein